MLDTPDYFCVSDDDPKDVADAMRQPNWSEWQLSMGNELTSLRAHNVWTLIPQDQVSIGKCIIPSKFCSNTSWTNTEKFANVNPVLSPKASLSDQASILTKPMHL